MTKDIFTEDLTQILLHSTAELKEYINALPDRLFSTRDEKALKSVTARYYICAGEITGDFDRICALVQKISVDTEDARSNANEEAIEKLLVEFEKIFEISRAYEAFLQSSEAIISNKSQEVSFAALRQAAVLLYNTLSSRLS